MIERNSEKLADILATSMSHLYDIALYSLLGALQMS